MALFERHADVTWEGPLKEGNGTAKAGTGGGRSRLGSTARNPIRRIPATTNRIASASGAIHTASLLRRIKR